MRENPGSSAPPSRLRDWIPVLLTGLALLHPEVGFGASCTGISPASSAQLDAVVIATGLPRPLFVTSIPGDNSRIFVLEQGGRIRVLRGASLLPTPFLDITSITASPDNGGFGEQGLLGLAFDPAYATNGWFYVYYTPISGGRNIVARYTRSALDPDIADPNSGVEVLSITHPGGFHNAGMLAFGPADGLLYVGVGDGGDYCDRVGNAQNGATDMGKILRVDARHVPATIPPSNPFVGPDGVNDEIWALGLRNPWRFSFDPLTFDLYLGDVGQASREEIDFRPAGSPGGENYGWNSYEGSVCPNPSCGSASCSVPSYEPPVLDYDHTNGCAVVAGYVYRGCRMPDLAGTFFYGDLCSAFVRTFQISGGTAVNLRDRTAELVPNGGAPIAWITSFGTDARGEIYVVDGGLGNGNIGTIYKIVPALPEIEVSGVGAKQLSVSASGWSWENVTAMSSQPISEYRVYRASAPSGPFECVHAGTEFSWAGGDSAAPAPGHAFYYVVIGVNASGEETNSGWGTNGSPRSLSGAACPP
ncbi:MAG: PQQ-dependent sugar dehydrogenase [Acidobacteria bacterium]|nr:PQQ-dependent sugar dehydrogenase [Acidobacteriota bacterium]